jgi:hypothetical protein
LNRASPGRFGPLGRPHSDKEPRQHGIGIGIVPRVGCNSPKIHFKPHLISWQRDVFLTPELTGIGRVHPNNRRRCQPEPRTMAVEFRTDEAQLLGLWMATRLLGEIRGVGDRGDQAELLTKAQMLLTAFVIGLEPLGSDRSNSASPRAGVRGVARFDA